MQSVEQLLIGGKTAKGWDQEWDVLDGGLRVDHPDLRYLVGLIRVSLNGQTKFIGRATGLPGGFTKRLSDFTRRSQSGRKHSAGKLIYRYRNDLTVEVLVIGCDHLAQATAKTLRGLMITLHNPAWNRITAKYKRKLRADQGGPRGSRSSAKSVLPASPGPN